MTVLIGSSFNNIVIPSLAQPSLSVNGATVTPLSVSGPQTAITASATEEVLLSVVLQGAGESSLPQAAKFTYSQDVLINRDYVIMSLQMYRDYLDSVTSSDISSTSVSKLVYDTAYLSDLVSKGVGKGSIIDTAYITADISSHSQKHLLDQLSGSFDTIYVEPTKYITNQLNTTDTISIQPNKHISDLTSTLEELSSNVQTSKSDNIAVTHTISIEANKALADQTFNYDITYLTPNKYELDQLIATDLVSTVVSFNTYLADSVYPTDDIFGEATIDDDQTASVIKNLIQIAYASDEASFTVSNNVSELLQLAEALSNNFSSVIPNDLYSVTDTISIQPNKHISDSSSILDSIYKTTNAVKTDILGILNPVTLTHYEVLPQTYFLEDYALEDYVTSYGNTYIYNY